MQGSGGHCYDELAWCEGEGEGLVREGDCDVWFGGGGKVVDVEGAVP